MRRRRRWHSPNETRVSIDMTAAQLYLIKEALELLVHCKIGAFDNELKDLINHEVYRKKEDEKKRELSEEEEARIARAFKDMFEAMFPDRVAQGPRVISDKALDEDVRIAWDIREVIWEWQYSPHTVIRLAKEMPLPVINDNGHTWEEFLMNTKDDLTKLSDGMLSGYTIAPEEVQNAVLDAVKVISKCLKPKKKSKTSV